MHECQRSVNLSHGQDGKPVEPLAAQFVPRDGRHLFDDGGHRLHGRRAGRKVGERLRSKQHFVGVPQDARPTEIANPIDNFARARSPLRQVAAVENQVGGHLLQVSQHSLEGRPVAMNIGDDGNAHGQSPGLLPSSNLGDGVGSGSGHRIFAGSFEVKHEIGFPGAVSSTTRSLFCEFWSGSSYRLFSPSGWPKPILPLLVNLPNSTT